MDLVAPIHLSQHSNFCNFTSSYMYHLKILLLYDLAVLDKHFVFCFSFALFVLEIEEYDHMSGNYGRETVKGGWWKKCMKQKLESETN